ncbi:pyruvate, water dikinase regulatory protein [Kineococcus gynurae]|uniref:Pyruvate, water dikinase regulatory protein n=1 Tax=Kineococcus gynurae TaxID=452979 RepID=A0ABV5LP46_9ACTN
MLDAVRADDGGPAVADDVVPVYFLSDSTGISAETMGNALLIQFPHLRFERTTIPFISTPDSAREAVRVLDEAMSGPVTPLAFTTAATPEIQAILHTTTCPLIDFFEMHLQRVEDLLHSAGVRQSLKLHGVGDVRRYNTRMQAVEFAMEHDDGQTARALDKADVILVGPSRSGKTPTSMYLALQHGLFVANYPLVEEDLEQAVLPARLSGVVGRCVGITTVPAQLAKIRQERRAHSRYASLETCAWELRRCEALYRAHGLPVLDSARTSIEEMSTLVLQWLRRWPTSPRPSP